MDTLHSYSRDFDTRRDHADLETTPLSGGANRRATTAAAAQPVASASSWYHDSAIEQANREAIETRCHPYDASR